MSEEAVADILQQGRIYEVGGAVRDRMLPGGPMTKDRDYLVTGIPYKNLSVILKKYGRIDLVGQSFGVIKFTQSRDGQASTCDISLPRTEHSTGWGHRDFEVSFDPDMAVEDDLVRRDFTVNAMAVSLEDKSLIDPLDGLADLKNRQLRMVHPRSFEEDPLRLLRAIQFAARLEFDIEKNTFAAMKSQAASITTVSAERIAEELNKLLTLARKPSIGFRLMNESGLLEHVLPELAGCVGVEQPGPYHAYDVFEHSLHTVDATPPRLLVRYAALFHDIFKPIAKRPIEGGATFYGHEVQGAKVAREILRRLRYSNDFVRDVSMLIERHMFTTDVTDKGMRRLIRRTGKQLIFDLLDLRRADVVAQGKGGTTEDVDEFEQAIRDELDRQPPLSTSDLVLDGHDVMKRYGLKPGPAVGRILNQLLEVVLDDPDMNTNEKLMTIADGLIDDIKNDLDRD